MSGGRPPHCHRDRSLRASLPQPDCPARSAVAAVGFPPIAAVARVFLTPSLSTPLRAAAARPQTSSPVRPHTQHYPGSPAAHYRFPRPDPVSRILGPRVNDSDIGAICPLDFAARGVDGFLYSVQMRYAVQRPPRSRATVSAEPPRLFVADALVFPVLGPGEH
jgi:hypothetical protein